MKAGHNSASPSAKKGDVVWAKFRKWPPWPAVVSGVYPKHLTVQWLPFPNGDKKPTSFRMALSSVKPFILADVQEERDESDKNLIDAVVSAKKLLLNAGQSRLPPPVKTKKSKSQAKIKPSYEYVIVKEECVEQFQPSGCDMYSKVKERTRKSTDQIKTELENVTNEGQSSESRTVATLRNLHDVTGIVNTDKDVKSGDGIALAVKSEKPKRKLRNHSDAVPNKNIEEHKRTSRSTIEQSRESFKTRPKPRNRPDAIGDKNSVEHRSRYSRKTRENISQSGKSHSLACEAAKIQLRSSKNSENKKSQGATLLVVGRRREAAKRHTHKVEPTEGASAVFKKRKFGPEIIQQEVKVEAEEVAEFPSLARLSSGLDEYDTSRPKFKRGDVVWVKYGRWQAWPSLVTRYDQKAKKVSFEYLPVEIPLTCKYKFRVQENKVQPYISAYYEHFTAANLENLQILDAVKQADRIRKHQIDPFPKDMPSTSPGSSRNEMSLFAKFGKIDLPSMEDDLPSVRNSEDSDDQEDSSASSQEEGERMRENKRLMEQILSEDTKAFLVQVYNEEIVNPRQEEWNKMRADMPAPRSFGPIVDEDQIEEVIEQLSAWYQDVNPDASVRNTFTYIACVWLPEAVKYAMQLALGYSEEEAEEKLNTAPTYYTAEQMNETREEMLNMARESEDHSAFDKLVEVACRERDSL